MDTGRGRLTVFGGVAPMRGLSRRPRWLACALSAVLAVTLLPGVPALAAAPRWRVPRPDAAPGVAVQRLPWTSRPTWTPTGREMHGDAEVVWPAARAATVDLSKAGAVAARAATSRAGAGARVRAAGLPVAVAAVVDGGKDASGLRGAASTAPAAVGVQVHDRATTSRAGVAGVLLRVRRADGVARSGKAAVSVDYRGFAAAYGGDWVSRLRLVRLPACAVTTPEGAGCTTATPLASATDFTAGTVTAVAPLAADGSATVLALEAGPNGDNGDYTATSLSPASTWQVSAQTGAFSWSYPLRVVPGVGGPEPSLSLWYNSQVIDGRTAGTNTQGSWVGDGWQLWPGFIERTYQTCAEDTDAVNGHDPNNKNNKTGDQCWWRSNATLSLNGSSTELVDAGGGLWKGVSDDGSRIELLKDVGLGNGDDDGEYWKVTTIDGTRYFFGRHHGIGGASAGSPTNSVWTTQVYGNHPGEPGYQAGDFAGSRRTQAWRWNLDYVVDPNGNTMTLFYGSETGAYGRENDPAKRTTYDRGGYLTRIEYGSRSDASSGTYAAARVVFDVADRCKAGATCYDAQSDPVPASWPDTPWDLYCQAAPCTDKLAPTYFTAKRLSKIRTQVYAGGGAYTDVESWTLRHEYLDAGYPYGEGIPMYLRGLTRTGHVTSAGGAVVSDPEIVFDPGADPLANRVDGPDDGKTALFRWRVHTITTETGAQIVVTFKPTDCTRSALPTPHSNTQRCMPQYYSNDGSEPVLDWFHKYVVDFVDVNDNTGASQAQKVFYDYLDAPAWHYDDSELVDEKKRTWGQFRGYGLVKVRKGFDTGVQLATEYRYLRGMDGDEQPSGVRDVHVSDSQGTSIEDHPAYAGMTLEETTLNGANGTWVSGTISTPTTPVQTAAANSLKAYMVNVGTQRTRTNLTWNSTVRWTKTVTKYNADNLPYEVNDLGDESTPTDDRCTRSWYARNANPAVWMLDRVKREQTVGVACTATPTFPADLIAESRTTYDNVANDWDTYLPVHGLPVKTEEVDRWAGSTPVWETISTTGYDANGRATSATDALGHTTTSVYTPTLTGPVTAVSVTNPKAQAVTTTLAPAWGLPVRTVDPNGAKTEMTYDGLGRLTAVWRPGRLKGSDSATIELDYLVRNTKPTAVTTRRLTATATGTAYKTSVTLFDGWLRERQTQTQAPGGGRVLTDTFYDSRGLIWWKAHPYYDITNTPVETELVGTVGQPVVPALTEYVYDGAGRVTAEILKQDGIGGTERWRTTTSYGGDRSTVTPPGGGTKTETVLDARGRTVELRHYHSRTGSTFDTTTYTYTDGGDLATVTDPAGNSWKYFYDQRGHKVRAEDPDKGVTLTGYDLAGNVTTVTDARGTVLVTTYDELGRRTSLRDGSATGPVRAAWEYDTLPNGIGRLTRSTRYDNGNQYVNEVGGYDVNGRVTSTKITIPSSEGALCAAGGATPCTYRFSTTYKPDGKVAASRLPAVSGDLPAEQLVFGYNSIGAPTSITSNLGIYVGVVGYNQIGELVERQLGGFGRRVQVNYTIDNVTGRLSDTTVSPENKPVPAHYQYTYNDAGDMTRIADAPYGQPADTQCYRHDHLRRLVDAWTPASGDCQPDPTTAGLGGPAPYWHSYEYAGPAGLTGSRTEETWHDSGGDTVRGYTYPTQGGAVGSRPHALTQVVTDRPTGADTVDTYGYDAAGNTTSRNLAGVSQTLAWDNEGRLASVTRSGTTVSYLYDADGNRLIRRDPAGAGTTLYLPGGMQVNLAPGAATATCTRYYTHVGQQIAVRTKTSLTWVVTDHHGTGEVNLDAADLAVQRRRTLPFGDVRGTPPASWAGDKGFVGGTIDPTGLTHLGAREYDPTTGRFISVDPLMAMADPQQWNGYAYAHNNPVTNSDPSGLIPADCRDFDCYGYDVKTGCPGGCGSTDNLNWGTANGRSSTKSRRHHDPNRLGHVIVMPDDIDKDEFSRQWRNQIAGALDRWHGSDFEMAQLFIAQDELALAMNICHDMGGSACKRWIEEELYPGYLAFLKPLASLDGIFTRTGGGRRPRISGATAFKALLPKRIRAKFCSFSADTAVLMADRTIKPINQIKVGDKVMATDPETGEQGPRKVTHVWVHDDQLRDLLLDDGSVVTTTEDHPFWNATDDQWQRADTLGAGESLLGPDGQRVGMVGVRLGPTLLATAYNLTVEGIHTYYVIAGSTPVLVHNCPAGNGTSGRYSKRPERVDSQDLKAETREPWRPVDRSEWATPLDHPAIPTTKWGKVKYGLARIAELIDAVRKTMG